MNRRGFLGLIGAGAVAGPAVAKTALTSGSPILANTASIGNMLDMGPCDVAGSVWSGREKANYAIERAGLLKRLISGEERQPEDIYELHRRKKMLIEHNINGLGSVSPIHKLRMVIGANNLIERESQRRHWMNELLDIERIL